MPVHRGRRYVYASVELNRWLGKESRAPVHIATKNEDLSADLNRRPLSQPFPVGLSQETGQNAQLMMRDRENAVLHHFKRSSRNSLT
jgi:hypothetical protein